MMRATENLRARWEAERARDGEGLESMATHDPLRKRQLNRDLSR